MMTKNCKCGFGKCSIHKKKKESFIEQIGRALDSLSDGRGFGIKEKKICDLAEAAPDLANALEKLIPIVEATHGAKEQVTMAYSALAKAGKWNGDKS